MIDVDDSESTMFVGAKFKIGQTKVDFTAPWLVPECISRLLRTILEESTFFSRPCEHLDAARRMTGDLY
jgi:hypothetical protein